MSRYFIEVSYKGTLYAGFQSQQNANAIQDEVEKALGIYFKRVFQLTGSSRTDAGVHALQNYFHFDFDFPEMVVWQKAVYHLNAILPADIVIRQIFAVDEKIKMMSEEEVKIEKYKLHFIQMNNYL